MSYQRKPNTGSLFKNDKKTTENHPDLSGSINIDGKDFWLSGWTKRNDDGSFKLVSLSVKAKDEKVPQRAREQAFHDDPFDGDSIPF